MVLYGLCLNKARLPTVYASPLITKDHVQHIQLCQFLKLTKEGLKTVRFSDSDKPCAVEYLSCCLESGTLTADNDIGLWSFDGEVLDVERNPAVVQVRGRSKGQSWIWWMGLPSLFASCNKDLREKLFDFLQDVKPPSTFRF